MQAIVASQAPKVAVVGSAKEEKIIHDDNEWGKSQVWRTDGVAVL